VGEAAQIETVPVTGRLAVSLSLLGRKAPGDIACLGALELLEGRCLGFVCSARCSGEAILEAYEVSKKLSPVEGAVVGGFHSPMERQFLEILLVRKVPAVVCVPRPLGGMRIPPLWKTAIQEGRLLLLSPMLFGSRRFSRPMAELRNAIVAAIADPIFVPYAAAGGSVEKLLTICAGWGKRILTVRCNDQAILRAVGAGEIEEWLSVREGGGGMKLILL
jgi:hypothetical protein